jgi:ubiquinone/menaquinone biosynthesis C-methylase UbiE
MKIVEASMSDEGWKKLYNEHADQYERLTRCEDIDGNLLKAINQIQPLRNRSVVEFGAGTGRITAQLLPLVERIWTFDISPAMVAVARQKFRGLANVNCLVGFGDSRAVPVASSAADLAVEGWSFLQIMVWHETNWREEVGKAIEEMKRVVRPGGVVILIETLGTGATTPEPPERFLEAYAYFEAEHSLLSEWIRTDYRFTTRAEASEFVSPFFGEEMLESLVEREDGFILPECTGLWWRQV